MTIDKFLLARRSKMSDGNDLRVSRCKSSKLKFDEYNNHVYITRIAMNLFQPRSETQGTTIEPDLDLKIFTRRVNHKNSQREIKR